MQQNIIATFAGGCFWCTEAVFQRLRGVEKVESGYTGGETKNPTYDTVSLGNTNHAEAIQITFDPKIISFEKLVKIFFHTHNPTTLNQQGADIGTQYRSAIFYHNEQQKEIALQEKQRFNTHNPYKKDAVTVIEQFAEFFPAENYHKNYYELNRNYPYCTAVIDPKIKRLLQNYRKDVKEKYQKVEGVI